MHTMPDTMTRALLGFANHVMESGEPSQQLFKVKNDIYLKRWYLLRTPRGDPRGQIYIHQTLRSDGDPEMHCHPAANHSIVLDGIIREETPDGIRTLQPGNVVSRAATDRHRLIIDTPTTTIFVMGPWEREWGFHSLTEGFIPSQDFFKKRGYN